MLKQLIEAVRVTDKPQVVSGLRGSAPALVGGQLAATQNCCCIVPDEQLVSILEDDLRLFSDRRVLVYPGYEIPPYTPLSPDQQTTAVRLSTLYHLQDGEPFILLTSMEALMRRVMPKALLLSCVELIMAGEECGQDQLLAKLVAGGYEQVSLVRNVGDFSRRGGIIGVSCTTLPCDSISLATPSSPCEASIP
jgi:transcription-repair coupling factor (superfamily II helicase)